ncbi:MAG: polymerase subunit delta, polymerase subunit delta protein [Candidatus Saccharibacteria bacterium]|nr:polymerase subunit delta, polymerase subunit delta protein [Candidatus Saccharibacteria bacterium]
MIITLTGPNSFLLKAELTTRTDSFLKQYGDMGLERYDGERLDPNTFLNNVQSMPFLVDKRLIIVRELSANKVLAEQIEHIIANVPDSTEVILVEPHLDKRLSYYKTLKKKTELKEFNEQDDGQLASWLVGEAKARGGQLNSGDARLLVGRIGANQAMLSNELDKLIAYDGQITRQSIELLSEASPQSTIFQLLDATLAGNYKQALQLYEQQRQLKVEPQAILALLGWQLHALALLKTAGQRTPEQIAREAKLNPFVVRKSQAVANRLSLPQLKQMIADTLQLDIKLKTQNIDADEAVTNLLISFR